jgi:hypothetical protein
MQQQTSCDAGCGTAARAMMVFAAAFEPIAAIAAGGGPTNTRPARAHAAANASFSDRNP